MRCNLPLMRRSAVFKQVNPLPCSKHGPTLRHRNRQRNRQERSLDMRGHIVRALQAKKPNVKITAVELHPDRVAQLRKLEGPNVQIIARNFLNEPAFPVYDAVVMNPPFYGTHWMDHVRHAWDFLKDGGRLVAVLPVSAAVDETPKHLAFRRWAEKANGGRVWGLFSDLPPESFLEAGTRINTTILSLRK